MLLPFFASFPASSASAPVREEGPVAEALCYILT